MFDRVLSNTLAFSPSRCGHSAVSPFQYTILVVNPINWRVLSSAFSLVTLTIQVGGKPSESHRVLWD